MGLIKQVAILIIVAVSAFFLGKITSPVKEKIVEVEVVKEKVNTVQVVREIKRPDGTIEKETRNEQTKEKESSSSKSVEFKPPGYGISLLAGNINDPYYTLLLEKKVVGNVKVGAWGNTRQEFGISVGLEF